MIGLIIVAHAPLATAFADCATHVLGQAPDDLQTYDCPPDADPSRNAAEIGQLIQQSSSEVGVLLLADLFGATPCNAAAIALVASPLPTGLLSGLNLAMLLRAISYRHLSLEALVQKALDGAMQGAVQVRADPHRAASLL